MKKETKKTKQNKTRREKKLLEHIKKGKVTRIVVINYHSFLQG